MANTYPHTGYRKLTNSPAKEWRRSVNDYRRLASFTFESEEEFGQAVAVFNQEGHPLNEAPFDTVPLNTVLVPAEAADIWSEWLGDQDIPFAMKAVVESRELPADIVAALRVRNYHPSF